MYQNSEEMVENNNVEVPQYFLCPISLQIMSDPVITTTGITYDRHSINQWLTTADPPVCPVTKRSLNSDHDFNRPVLTPNNTLLRLINSWSASNSPLTPATTENVISRADVIKNLRGVFVPRLHSASLDQLLALANSDVDEHVSNRRILIECGTLKALVLFIIKCYKENKILGLEKALRILNSIWVPTSRGIFNDLVAENRDLIDSLTWILNYKESDNNFDTLKNLTILLTKEVIKITSSSFMTDRMNREFFHGVVGILKQRDKIVGPTKAAVQVMLEVCQHGRNKYRLIESNVVFELIQLELDLGLARHELKRLSELVFALLAQLCSCAEGRAQLLAHAEGIFVVANRILEVSSVVDDRAVHILSQISKNNAATTEMLQEMVKVGVVYKLCMVIQADDGKYLKEKVRGILKRHSNVWRDCPGFEIPRLFP